VEEREREREREKERKKGDGLVLCSAPFQEGALLLPEANLCACTALPERERRIEVREIEEKGHLFLWWQNRRSKGSRRRKRKRTHTHTHTHTHRGVV
jgi:hypothetical protein